MKLKDRLYVGTLVVFASIILSQFASFESSKPKVTGVQVTSVAAAQEKAAPDKNPPKGMEELKKNAKAFQRGAKPTPKAKIFAAAKFSPVGIRALPQVAYVPKKLSYWGNNQYGICVTSEEMFNQDACGTFIEESTAIAWARKHGYLNGADLLEVMQSMVRDPIQSDGHGYSVSTTPKTVNFSDESALQAALSIAPVKIGIDANALPSGAGNNQGWYSTSHATHQNEDHCVSLAGYGPADYLYKQLGVPLPSGLAPTQQGYLLFTWSTIGFVDHGWLMGCCSEAWLRDPTQVVDGKPSPNPGPVQTVPSITSALAAAATTGTLFSYQITATNSPNQYAAAGLPDGVSCAPSTGLITGIPKAAGSFTVTLSASNGSGSGTAVLLLTVSGAPVPPGPTPTPVPSGVKLILSAEQVLRLQRDPTNTFELTITQVQHVINDAGMEVIDGKMSLVDFQAAVNRATAKPSRYNPPQPKPIITVDDRIERIEKALIELMKKETK